MSRTDDLSSDELARLFGADPDAPPPGAAELALSLPSIPPTSPMVAALRRDLEHFVAAGGRSPAGDRAADLLRGHGDLRAFLADPGMPSPDEVRLPAAARRFLDEIDPEEKPDA